MWKNKKQILFLFIIIIFFINSITFVNAYNYNDCVLPEDKTTMVTMERKQYFKWSSDYEFKHIQNVNAKHLNLADSLYNQMLNYEKRYFKFSGNKDDILSIVAIINSKYFEYTHFWWVPDDDAKEFTVEVDMRDFKKYTKINKETEVRIQEIVQELGINKNMTEYEAIDKIDTWLINNVEYDYTIQASSISSVLLERKGICASYSEAFEAICNYVGINSYWVTSDKLNHEWNAVKLNNNFYEIDTCWNSGVKDKTYFLLSHEEMMKTHGEYDTYDSYSNSNLWKIEIPKTYKITYKLNGGKNNENNLKFISNKYSINLKKPTKIGYKFMGWYLEPTYQTKVTNTKNINKDTTLYAKWEKNKKNISFKIKKTNFKLKLDGNKLTINTKNNENTKIVFTYINKNGKLIKKNIKNTYTLNNLHNKSKIKLKYYTINKETTKHIKTINISKKLMLN